MKRSRIPFLVAALGALVAGVWAGLLRMGCMLEPRDPDLLAAHGPLMVAGFLGTVIGLERAAALGVRWGYLGPVFTALGVVVLIVSLPHPTAPALALAGSLLLVAMSVAVYRRGGGFDTAILVAAAAAWLAGNLIWLVDRPLYQSVPWWAAFLVLTIVGERLDLSRLVRVPAVAGWLIRAALLVYFSGTALTLVDNGAGWRVAGAGMVALALWLLRYDVAHRTVRQDGVTRFIAVCILTGAAWLAVSGVLAFVFGDVRAGMRYDVLLHTLFLGFVFALIFGHAPITLPAVTGLAMAFRSTFYLHLVLLHGSVLIRLVAGLDGNPAMRRWSGMVSAVALLLFLVNTAVGVIAARQTRVASRQQTLAPSGVPPRR